ncbi:MAG: hypothetical protein CVT47_01250 [Thermoplasmata archaeon HGW-Thermoplasmata-2]|nr:MAG: hypothetical protein CVT47_01250 [Thermoplasmata archaeon HGW-Thermoplasmata-2]
MNAIKAALLAAVLIIGAVSGCVGNGKETEFSNAGFDVEFLVNGAENASVVSGEIAEFSFKTNLQNAAVLLPPSFLVIEGEKIIYSATVNFSSGEAKFKALVPPTGRKFDLTVTNGEASKTLKLETVNGSSPLVSGSKIMEMEKHVTSTYLLRITGSPTLELYKVYLKTILESYGLEVHLTPVESGDGRTLLNLVAYHWGASDKDWIVIGGHADTAFEITIEGVYDNTAGTVTVLELARVLSQYKFDNTIVFGLWGGEEEGLWGSKFFVDNIPQDVKVEAYLNFDMVGINWPGPAPLHEYMACSNASSIKKMVGFGKFVTHDVCGFPETKGAFEIKKDSLGRSDHVRFADAGIPSFMFIGELDNYPYYHTPDDTLANMIEYMGGEEMLVKGFAVPAWIGFYNTVFIDNNRFLEMGWDGGEEEDDD